MEERKPLGIINHFSFQKSLCLQWRYSYYRTFYSRIFQFLVTFNSLYKVKCDQKVEYGAIKKFYSKNFSTVNNCCRQPEEKHHFYQTSRFICKRYSSNLKLTVFTKVKKNAPCSQVNLNPNFRD